MTEARPGPGALRAIVRSFSASDAQDLSLDLGGTRLHITKWPADDPAVPGGPVEARPTVPAAGSAVAVEPSGSAPGGPGATEVRAPLLGLFRPAPAFRVGAAVAADDELGSIDVRGRLTAVPAGTAGTIIELGTGEGELVEYHQVIARIEAGS